jgi:antiviral defense system Shedu protein SduA
LGDASVSDSVLRDGDLTRLIFCPEMVDNEKNPEACLRGAFIYQKRGKNDEWADVETAALTTLKKGANYQLLIKSGELLHLMKSLGPL